ncbi:MAG TPA: GNAT family N-acetyltransferase [Candidatus Binatia bacterium]|nr:GNAT family N-acetyltransferase [Candidatus Binatia bacterium]
MPPPLDHPRAVEVFEEKDFYLEQFRGRSVVVAVAPEVTAARPDLWPLARTVAELVRNDTRVVVWWPASTFAAERRLVAALRRARVPVHRRATRHAAASLLRVASHELAGTAGEQVRARLWEALRRGRLAVVVVGGNASVGAAAGFAVALHVPKLVLLDPRGGLLGNRPGRLSFVDENLLDTLLREGEAEWTGLGDRRPLLTAVRDALLGGVESVNVCTPETVGDELFTYAGSGTLFTLSDYCHVAPLGLDDFAQAERLLERGQREGVLKLRSRAEVAQVLAVGYGATFQPRQLAGVVGLLTAPYAAERAGEIVALYTITRFKGEGIGERLVTRLVADAERIGLDYVFACAVDDRAKEFFVRLGFERVGADDVPAAKWVGYDPRRRARVGVFRRRLSSAVAAAVRAR